MDEEATPSTGEHVEALPPRAEVEGLPTSIDGDQTNHEEGDTTEVEQTRTSEEPVLVDGDQARAGQVNTALAEQTAPSEELVTVPIMKLQQLVEFCAQVLRECRSREAPAPDLESGPPPISLPDITIDPVQATGNYLFTDNDFQVHGLYIQCHELTIDSEAEVDQIWNFVERFPIHELFDSKEDPDAKHVMKSCLTMADLHVLFQGESDSFCPDIRHVQEVFEIYMEATYSSFVPPYQYKLMVAVCAYGREVDNLGGIVQGCYSSGVLKRPTIAEPSAYMSDVGRVVECMLLFNRACRFGKEKHRFTYGNWTSIGRYQEHLYNLFRPIFTGHSLNEILGIPLPQLFRMMFLAATEASLETNDVAAGPTLRLDDFNVRSLASLGGLRMVWTLVLEDHLLLNLANMTLSIVWETSHTCGLSSMGSWERIGKGILWDDIY
ncbi:hypothetical protein DL98DRAFT_536225 [Cadophora sp. DSE1049]|nr:hypothetical protein DL98DRAFT_536225 [Cadophora sp. DSE1049]